MNMKAKNENKESVKTYKTAADFRQPDPMEQYRSLLDMAKSMMPQPNKCAICKKPLAAADPTVQYYDKDRGLITVCSPCTIKAIDFYITHVSAIA